MFNRLYIKNIQSHKDTTLSLHPGLNVIKGKGLSGKTAIWRAIRLLATNRPLGFRYHNNATKAPDSAVTAFLAEGTPITLTKTKKTATYQIGDDEPLRKIGQNVPKEVKEALNINPLNFQGQLDPPFLVTDTPGEIFREINRITNSEQIDVWNRIATSKINDSKREAGRQGGKIKELNTKIRRLPNKDLSQLDQLISKIEGIETEEVTLTSELDKIDDCLAKIADLEQKIKQKGEYLKVNQYLKEIESNVQKIKALKRESVALSNILDMKEELERAVKKKERFINRYAKALKDGRECPTCFNRIKPADVKRIIREMQ